MTSQNDNSINENILNGNNDDTLKWFDKNYLEKVLTNYENCQIEIITFNIKPATNKGENYVSAMHLITTEYKIQSKELKKLSLIVKTQLNNEIIAEIIEQFNVFDREIQVYRVIKNEFENLLRSIGDKTIFGPRAIYLDTGIIILENLKEKGYQICDIKNGLNYIHCLMFIEKLAKFHACSMITYNKNPELFKYHMPGNLTENENPMHDFYKNVILSCIEFIKTIPELQKYVKKMENFSKDIIQKVCKTFTRNSSNQFYILNHGDAWCNNLMYKKNVLTGEIEDILMIDYQEGYYGSLGIDWNYFMYTSLNKDVYVNYKDQLIKEYHRILSNTLYKLNYHKKIPTLQDVHDEIKSKNEYGLAVTTCFLPILISEHPDLSDPINFVTDSDEAKTIRSIVFNNKNYIELLKIYLNDFSEDGVF